MSDLVKFESKTIDAIVALIESSKHRVAKTINSELTLLYWNIGKQINEDVLQYDRAEYGKTIILKLSKVLTEKYGNGFSKRNIHNFIRFNEIIPSVEIVQTLSAQLSWSHIYSLIYIENDLKREFYIQMAIYERWSVRTLQERIDSMLFERTAISKKPEQINYLTLNSNDQIKVAEYTTALPDKKILEEKLQLAIELAQNSINS